MNYNCPKCNKNLRFKLLSSINPIPSKKPSSLMKALKAEPYVLPACPYCKSALQLNTHPSEYKYIILILGTAIVFILLLYISNIKIALVAACITALFTVILILRHNFITLRTWNRWNLFKP